MVRRVRRVDARDVLDANATIARPFSGRIVGVYRRSGPNAWDDYVLDEKDAGPIRVLAGTDVQVEDEGAVVRLRRKGEVVVVTWVPQPGELGPGEEPRSRFLERYLGEEDPTPDGNLGRWLHGKLEPKRHAND